jgi:hypothetical protein
MTAGRYGAAMKFPPGLGDTDSIVNLDEVIGRTVGDMKPVPPQKRYASLLRMGRGLTGGRTSLPRGVFRFETHEQSNSWEMQQILKRAKH